MIYKIKAQFNTVFSHEPWWVEFWSACTALLWAYIAQLSGDEIYANIIFIELSILARAQVWQVCAVVLGVCQLIALIINDYKIRWVMCFFASWFWSFLVLAILKTEPHPPGLALYISYACINLVSMIKLARSHV